MSPERFWPGVVRLNRLLPGSAVFHQTQLKMALQNLRGFEAIRSASLDRRIRSTPKHNKKCTGNRFNRSKEYLGKMPKEKITIGTANFRVSRNEELYVVHREGSNAPIDEVTQRQVAFVLEITNRRNVPKVRACNGMNSILQRPKDGWNGGDDWTELLPAELRKKPVTSANQTSPNGNGSTSLAFNRPPQTVRRGNSPLRAFQRVSHSPHSNMPPSDQIRTFVGPRAMS